MNPKAVEKMGKEWEEGGFGRREFPLWVLRNQALVLALVAAAGVDTVPAVAAGCDGDGEGERTGFGDKRGKDYHCNWRYCFGGGEGGLSWTLKPSDSTKRGRSSYQVLPLKTRSSLSRELSSRTPNPYYLLPFSSMWMWVCCLVG